MRKIFYLIPLVFVLGCGWVGRPIFGTGQKNKETYFIVSVEKANLRKGPGTRFPILSRANEGDRYPVLEAVQPYGETYPWYKIKTSPFKYAWINGSVGYVGRPGDYTEAKPREPEKVYKPGNVFDAPPNEVWSATLSGLEWMKWVPAFTDEGEGVIKLKEAYVYRKSGKLFRIYHWPPGDELGQSSIDDYLEKVALYNNDIFNFDGAVFSQEGMEIKLMRLPESRTKVEIDYTIRPYLGSGGFTHDAKSSGYIESLLLEQIRENLEGKPLAGRQFR